MTGMRLKIDQALVGLKIALCHSELSEMLEGHRKGLMDDHLPHRPMIECEAADAVIRISDLCGALGLDLGGAPLPTNSSITVTVLTTRSRIAVPKAERNTDMKIIQASAQIEAATPNLEEVIEAAGRTC